MEWYEWLYFFGGVFGYIIITAGIAEILARRTMRRVEAELRTSIEPLREDEG